ncbi:MAG: MFS transporter [Thermoguttaceae bacterium]|jgi:MFS family permease
MTNPGAKKPPQGLSPSQRRWAWNMAYWNIGLWAIGNGLTSTTLVIFLALQLDAKKIGLGIGLILAMPQLVGLLRLTTPVLIGRIADRKTFCLGTFLLSGLLLFCLPLAAAPGMLQSAGMSLAALVILWSLHHLMQYLGTVALYSWLADIAPLRIRGRFFGFRQRWLVAGEAIGALACGWFSYWWIKNHAESLQWIGYAIPAGLGAWFMIAAIVPLWMMPKAEKVTHKRPAIDWKLLTRPFTDSRFLRLLLFGCWFSFSNGLTQTMQTTFPAKVLQVSLLTMLAVSTAMRLGQLSISPALGRMCDRIGNKSVMLFCLVLTAQGPLFYFFSTPQAPWWFVGAWIVWIAYAGLNIGLPNLMLKLAPDRSSGATGKASGATGSASASNTPYIAAYFTVTGLCYAANTILGGWLFDRFGTSTFEFLGGTLDYNQWIFLLGWMARCSGIIALLLVIEPRSNKQNQ